MPRKYKLSALAGKIIAIDGPAGSGKSTTARMVAARLGFRYLDTGAMYRAVTLLARQAGISPAEGARLAELAKTTRFEFRMRDSVNRVLVNGRDVTDEIRSPEVTQQVSEVSAHAGVRQALVAQQRKLGREGSIVAEGRDTTTVVFAHAHVKVYLDASVRCRAQRRLLDMARMGVATSLDEQEAEITRRDVYDSSRGNSPLMRAKDAYLVDTSNMTIEDQVEHVISLIRQVIK